MKAPTRLLLALAACLSVAGFVEARLMPPGHPPDHLMRTQHQSAPAPTWFAALR